MRIVQVLCLRVDNFNLGNCTPVTKDINCEGANVVKMGWMQPVYDGGVRVDWMVRLGGQADKPSLDSQRFLQIETAQPEVHNFYMAVADDATPNIFTDLCNACCGTTPVAPPYTPPVPITEDCACPDADTGNYLFSYPMPLNPNGLAIKFTSYSFNGAYGTPTPPASFANNAAALTWVQANWGAYGTWTLVSGVLKLSGTTTKCMGLAFQLVDADYCMPYPSSGVLTADSLVYQTSATGPTTAVANFPGGAVTFSNTSTGPLPYVLQQLLNGTLLVNPGVPNRLQYTGQQVPVKLQLAGVDVAGAVFSSGICMNTFTFAIPTNPSSFNYFITAATFNNSAASPAPLGIGHATTGAMLTWLNANWAGYGTWTIVGSNLILSTHTTFQAALTISVHA